MPYPSFVSCSGQPAQASIEQLVRPRPCIFTHLLCPIMPRGWRRGAPSARVESHFGSSAEPSLLHTEGVPRRLEQDGWGYHWETPGWDPNLSTTGQPVPTPHSPGALHLQRYKAGPHVGALTDRHKCILCSSLGHLTTEGKKLREAIWGSAEKRTWSCPKF